MRTTVSAVEARKRLGSLLDDVRLRGTTVIIERYGHPAAAVVPLSLLEKLDRQRDTAFRRIDALREKIAERVSPEEFDELLTSELEEVRAVRRSAGKRTPSHSYPNPKNP